jgi:hypothetical protein
MVMDNRNWWAPMLGAAVVLWLLFSLAFVAVSGWNDYVQFLSGPAAAWVQALGSVAAIVAAIWIGQSQLSAARRLEAEKQDRADILKTEVLYSLFGEAEFLCEQCLRSLEEPGPKRERLARTLFRMGEVADLAHGMPIFESPGRLMSFAVLEAPKALRDLQAAVAGCEADWETWGELTNEKRTEFMRSHTHAEGFFRQAARNCRGQIERLRAMLPVDPRVHPTKPVIEDEAASSPY